MDSDGECQVSGAAFGNLRDNIRCAENFPIVDATDSNGPIPQVQAVKMRSVVWRRPHR